MTQAAPAAPDEDAVSGLVALLWRLQAALDRVRASSGEGVSDRDRLALTLVARQPDLLPSQLAARLLTSPSTVTGVLDRLEGARLIERRKDPDDERRKRIRVTPTGERMLRSEDRLQEALHRLLLRVPQPALVAALEVLALIEAELRRQDGGGT